MSGPFVPTTDEVRAAYVDGAGFYRDVAGDWFDRWLAQVKADAWDEGYSKGRVDCEIRPYILSAPHNPYRTGDGQ